MRDRPVRAMAAALMLLTCVAPRPATAQEGLGHVDDASVLPRGVFRLRPAAVWTRHDSRFTAFGIEPLGSSLTADSLGPTRFTPLAPIEALIATASGQPFSLSLGNSRVDALRRREQVPLALEYGLTRRLTVGVTVPVVRARVAVQFRLDSSGANAGPNLHRTSTTARQNNTAVQTQFASAAQQLRDRLTFCDANPGSTGCAELAMRRAEAEALLAASDDFAAAAAALFGSADSEGQAFVPTAQSQAQLGIAARIADFNAQYRDLLDAGSDVLTAIPAGAAGPAGVAQFQQFLHDELGRDSLVTRERVGFGDVELRLKALVLDRPMTQARRLGTQIAVLGAVHLPTGSRQSPSSLADLSLGSGATTVDVRAFGDAQLGRAGVLASLGGLTRTGALDDGRDSRVLSLQVAPRWHLSAPLAVHAAYTMRRGNATETMQFVGGGISFTQPGGVRSGIARLPIEMRFTHLEAVSGGVGQPKFFRDQIELRLYYR